MASRPLAESEYKQALRKAFWRKVASLVTGEKNELLPFDEVRERLPMKGQSYLGLREVEVNKIVGSMGRYRDFDRAFLPIQTGTRDRWISVDSAHIEQVPLPPVDLYKIGEVYFVRDGNHRVSVARGRGQIMIDAFVTEIIVSVPLTADTDVDDLVLKQEMAVFLEETRIKSLIPEAEIELTLPGEYKRMLEHINTHRWFMGEQKGHEVTFGEALVSWFYDVYMPLVLVIRAVDLEQEFPGRTEADLYLWIVEYQWYRRQAYRGKASIEAAAREFAEACVGWPAKRLVRVLKDAAWVDNLVILQEKAAFLEQTQLASSRPEFDLELTQPGQYEKLLDHINLHRWYLGEEHGQDVPIEVAAESFLEKLYEPMAGLIREQGILAEFPGRTEADLVLWILDHRSALSERLGWEVPLEAAASDLSGQAAGKEEAALEVPSADLLVSSVLGTSLQDADKPRLHSWTGRLQPFTEILVAFDGRESGWRALEQALVIAQREGGRIHGLHVLREEPEPATLKGLQEEFARACQQANTTGELIVTSGEVTANVIERQRWIDLVVVSLTHPPSLQPVVKLGSGLRKLIRASARPILAVPAEPTELDHPLLAYDGSRTADEALTLAVALTLRWEQNLALLSVQEPGKRAINLENAQEYLERQEVTATFLLESSDRPSQAILKVSQSRGNDLLILGGYYHHPVIEVILGSTLDYVLRESGLPILISK